MCEQKITCPHFWQGWKNIDSKEEKPRITYLCCFETIENKTVFKIQFRKKVGVLYSLQLLGNRKLDRTMFVCHPVRNGDRK
jgi:hypothetical protein